MKRYYILVNKYADSTYRPMCSLWFKEWLIVPTKADPIGDSCFYRARKWCGEVWYFLYDAPTGTYICREPSLKDLKYHVDNEIFKIELEQVRKSKFYSSMLQHYNKALEEYKERVKGGNRNDK